MVNTKVVQSEKGLRVQIKRNLNKEIHPATKPSIDFIHKILTDAYESGMTYDVTDMRNAVLAFAANSTNQADYCIKLVGGIRSMNDGEHYTVIEENNVVRYGYAEAGDGEKLLPRSLATGIADYAFSPDERCLLVASGRTPIYRHSYTTKYYLSDGQTLEPVLPDAQAPRDASFSPDGSAILYSDRNDLYLYDMASRKTRRLTSDGEWNAVINGTTDWVYEEEFGLTRAYAFSPDGRRVAYLRFDEREVPTMQMMRFDGKLHNEAFSFKYPKAGDPNSKVQLFVVDLATGERERIDTGPDSDQYLPRIGFTSLSFRRAA